MTKVIRVQFSQAGGSAMPVNENLRQLSSREYDYFLISDDVEVRKGSLAVVDVSGVLRIVQINAVMGRSSKATKHAITVFNLEQHKELLKRKEAIAELRQAIFERAEESRERQRLEELAGSDTELRKMLDDLKTLEAGQ